MATRTKTEYTEQDKIQQTDHDSLIRMESKMDQLIGDVRNLKDVDIRELKDGMASKLSELERRMKSIEDLKTKLFGSFLAVSVGLTVFGFYIRGFIEDVYSHVYGH